MRVLFNGIEMLQAIQEQDLNGRMVAVYSENKNKPLYAAEIVNNKMIIKVPPTLSEELKENNPFRIGKPVSMEMIMSKHVEFQILDFELEGE